MYSQSTFGTQITINELCFMLAPQGTCNTFRNYLKKITINVLCLDDTCELESIRGLLFKICSWLLLQENSFRLHITIGYFEEMHVYIWCWCCLPRHNFGVVMLFCVSWPVNFHFSVKLYTDLLILFEKFVVCTSHFVVMFNCGDGLGRTKRLCNAYISRSTRGLRSLLREHVRCTPLLLKLCPELVTIPMVTVFSFPSNHFKYALCMYCLVHG